MSKKYIVLISHSNDEPYRTSITMGLVSCLVLEGADVALFFMSEGVKMVQKGVAETIKEKNGFYSELAKKMLEFKK